MTREAKACDYCGQDAEKCTGAEIYQHRPDLANSQFYRCKPCGAHVGCHAKTGKPFGRLAKADLRAAKMKAHAAFDPLWKFKFYESRKAAYAWLAEKMEISKAECHIGMFDLGSCLKAENICLERVI